jgi:ABC-type antimicrobial peptide transport system permease subunit
MVEGGPPRGGPAAGRPLHTTVQVIGITEDVVSGSLLEGIDEALVYFATDVQSPEEMTLIVRSRTDAESLRAVVTSTLDGIERDVPFQFYSLRALVGGMAWMFQAFSTVALLLGIVGLLLAFSGTYAVVSFLVTRRTREFGVRMALGATVRQIVYGIMVDTSRTAGMGVAGGLLISAALIRLLGAAIPITPAFGPGHFAAAAAVVLAATGVAALLPSARTARIEPSHALRAE